MIHPDTTVRTVSDQIGVGVFATEFIPKGTIIVVRDSFDLCLTHDEFQELPCLMRKNMETYMYHDKDGKLIMSWDHARYMNHNCNSNTLMTGYDLEIAIRDIHPGDEITTDYGLLNVQESYELYCECRDCRGILRADDIDRFADLWDDNILSSLLEVKSVFQPLEPLLSNPYKEQLEEVLQHPDKYSSVKKIKWPKP